MDQCQMTSALFSQYEDFISKVETPETESGVRYRLAFRNFGRRGIVDVDLFVRLSIKGLNPKFNTNSHPACHRQQI
jgi:hypothetical protein